MIPVCADFFGDADLRAIVDVIPLSKYPDDILAASRAAPPSPWMYTGALENHPELIAAISDSRPLWGNPPQALARVRDPLMVHETLRQAGLASPEILLGIDAPPADGRWLAKPLLSGGGHGIHCWDGAVQSDPGFATSHYFQRLATGRPLSALFIATRDTAHLIGCAWQLVGEEAMHALTFAYCGSIGPLDGRNSSISAAAVERVRRTGETMAEFAQLRGVFGIDFVLGGDTPWLIEVNPRYPASAEIYEIALDFCVVGWHRCACEAFDNSAESARLDRALEAELGRRRAAQRRVIGKGILFAGRHLHAPDLSEVVATNAGGIANDEYGLEPGLTLVSDRPLSGTPIALHRPICSVFAAAPDDEACLRVLLHRVRLLDRLLECT